MARICVLLISFLAFFVNFVLGEGHSFGYNVEWHLDLNEGLRLAKAHNKPIMVVAQEPWCPRCLDLGDEFADSKEITKLCKKFVMVIGGTNVVKYSYPAMQDNYVPRIYFITPEGRIMDEIYNKRGIKRFKYYYANVPHILKNMEVCLKAVNKKQNPN